MQEIYVPATGMASDGIYLAKWLKEPGESVKDGEPIALIETDKAEMSVDAPAAGIVGRHLFSDDTTVDPGATITFLLAPGEEESDLPATDIKQAGAARSAEATIAAPSVSTPSVEHAAAVRQSGSPLRREDRPRDPLTGELAPYDLSPRRRSAARERPADRDQPSAPFEAGARPAAGVSAAAAVPDNQEVSQSPAQHPDRYRAAVAEAVSRSWAEIPHFAVDREIRMEQLLGVMRSFRAMGSDVNLTDVILKTYALVLVERLGTTSIDLGLAVATPKGVAIPVLLDVARRDLRMIAQSRKAAVGRALAGQLKVEDNSVPQSTVSNLGSFGVDSFTGIVPLGQTSLLTVGTAAPRPAVEDGALVVATTAHLTLNVDHRVWDGQDAAEVLGRFAAIAADPVLLLALS